MTVLWFSSVLQAKDATVSKTHKLRKRHKDITLKPSWVIRHVTTELRSNTLDAVSLSLSIISVDVIYMETQTVSKMLDGHSLLQWLIA
jgi:hypothetical protein